MAHIDVFNGDADGLCALHQLRLAQPIESTLITGTKRDIALLQRVHAQAGDSVTVLDLCVDANREPLLALLEAGVHVTYYDHHACSPLHAHPRLHARIDPDPQVCTAMLVDHALGGRYRHWAIVGAYGDNLHRAARRLACSLRLTSHERLALRRLGRTLNYNAYGESSDDLIIHPAQLYPILHRYTDPQDALRETVIIDIERSLQADLRRGCEIKPLQSTAGGRVTLLPDAAWSRRVCGTLANELARDEPMLAHAVVAPCRKDTYTVSVRAPLVSMHGADVLCARFAGGGGRPAAAGITRLPAHALDDFLQAFMQAFPAQAHQCLR